ncbi:MAG: guanine deaminase [Alphaproteobacteria bacterium]
MSRLTLHRGSIFHLRDDPDNGAEAVEWLADGALLIEDGHVAAVGEAAKVRAPADAETIAHEGIIAPGFIDAHVHYPQTDLIGADGKDLLDWLARYTFPAESAFSDPAHAAATAENFLDELLRNGVTSAAVFATTHAVSADAIFAAAEARNMRLISGKVLMDAHAPAALLDPPGGGIDESEALIRRWHGKGRLHYAVTPRFALTSSPLQLQGAGRLLEAHSDVYMHTHLAENVDECIHAVQRHPGASDYLAIYERYGLSRARSIFAHSVHLSADAFARLASAEAAIAFCPTSNTFLGSGFFDLAAARRAGVGVALGTDVGGGTSFSMLATMAEAYKVGQTHKAPLNAFAAFYLATLGAARALKLDDKLGNFAIGKEADFVVLDPAATPLLSRRACAAKSLHEMLFALMIMGDDRAVRETWIAGARAHARDDAPPTPQKWRGPWLNRTI